MQTKITRIIQTGIRNIFSFIAKYTSYVLAVTLCSAGLGGIIATSFALYYFHALHYEFPSIILLSMKVGIVALWLLSAYRFGLFYRLGLKGGGKGEDLNTINECVLTNPKIAIKENLTPEEYQKLLLSLAKLPKIVSLTISSGIVLLATPLLIYQIYLEGIIPAKILAILSLTTIAIFIIICFSLIISEVLTGELRAACMKLVHRKNIKIAATGKNKTLYTVKTKLLFFLILFIITLFISNVITYSNQGQLSTVFSFSFLAIFVSLCMAYLIFYIIYNSLKQVENAAYDLMQGGEGMLFPRSLDLEFVNLADGINIAAKTIRDYQKGLEIKVDERTRELNESLKQLRRKDEIMETELDFAANIQQGIIPSQEDLAPWNGISFASYYQPMGKVSGDYYDLFRFDNQLYFLLADVSGHGVPAALITMAAKQAFASAVGHDRSPAEIFKEVNGLLVEKIKTSDYLTAFLLQINDKHEVTYCNASHTKAIHYIHSLEEYRLLDTDGMFIGAIEEASEFYDNKDLHLASGDRIYLYTDGVVEHKNTDSEEFGMDRLLSLLTQTKFLPLNEQLLQVISELKAFMGEAPVRDDISMFALDLQEEWSKFAELYNAGLKHLRINKAKEALLNFLGAKNIIPDYTTLKYQLALAYYGTEEYEEALPLLQEFLVENPKDSKGLQLGVNIYLKLKRKENAREFMQRLRALDALEEN
ncbi:MAG: SpoIIE family protein phosphatase [Spirochaetota bacterium]